MNPVSMERGRFFGTSGRESETPSFHFAVRSAVLPDHEVPLHTHDEAHYVLVLRGEYVTAASGKNLEQPLVYNPAGTVHRDRFRQDGGRFLTISVSSSVSTLIDRAVTLPTIVSSPAILRLVHSVQEELLREEIHSELVLEGLGLELAGYTGRAESASGSRPPHWLLRCRDSIRDQQDVSIASAALDAGVHPVHLARMFRRHFHCSPGEYQRQCRIERVKTLLQLPSLSLSEVALEAGFSEQSALHRAFRRSTGMTPAQFRRLLN